MNERKNRGLRAGHNPGNESLQWSRSMNERKNKSDRYKDTWEVFASMEPLDERAEELLEVDAKIVASKASMEPLDERAEERGGR